MPSPNVKQFIKIKKKIIKKGVFFVQPYSDHNLAFLCDFRVKQVVQHENKTEQQWMTNNSDSQLHSEKDFHIVSTTVMALKDPQKS